MKRLTDYNIDDLTLVVNIHGMGESKHRSEILDAAAAAFIRYGFKRVTMGDIAEGAGISRPTLYGVFSNKEDVFRGVVTHFHESAIAEIEARIESVESLPERLEIAFDVWLVRAYRTIHESPDAKELVESTHAFACDVFEEAYRRFEALLASIIAPYAEQLGLIEMTPEQLAQVLSASGRGMKAHARDGDALFQLVSGLIRMTVASLYPSKTAKKVVESVA